MRLPIQNKLVEAEIDVARVLLLIFTEHSMEEQRYRNINQQKRSIEKVFKKLQFSSFPPSSCVLLR